ncbi:uncharacterized protein PAC_16431 [Phialocephala subalpina]|uniref:Uncharacterized protein n=1 Tax=Phialocephala subalpina TaxID=576137 RepID=A0A1L7XN99_9HELO|nr:uncharacterized protein PAC_16431 [Phialocephala subalpina]
MICNEGAVGEGSCICAPDLENFLESKWLSVKGLAKFLGGKHLLDSLDALLPQFGKTSQDDPKELADTQFSNSHCFGPCLVRGVSAESEGVREYKTVPANDDPLKLSIDSASLRPYCVDIIRSMGGKR